MSAPTSILRPDAVEFKPSSSTGESYDMSAITVSTLGTPKLDCHASDQLGTSTTVCSNSSKNGWTKLNPDAPTFIPNGQYGATVTSLQLNDPAQTASTMSLTQDAMRKTAPLLDGTFNDAKALPPYTSYPAHASLSANCSLVSPMAAGSTPYPKAAASTANFQGAQQPLHYQDPTSSLGTSNYVGSPVSSAGAFYYSQRHPVFRQEPNTYLMYSHPMLYPVPPGTQAQLPMVGAPYAAFKGSEFESGVSKPTGDAAVNKVSGDEYIPGGPGSHHTPSAGDDTTQKSFGETSDALHNMEGGGLAPGGYEKHHMLASNYREPSNSYFPAKMQHSQQNDYDMAAVGYDQEKILRCSEEDIMSSKHPQQSHYLASNKQRYADDYGRNQNYARRRGGHQNIRNNYRSRYTGDKHSEHFGDNMKNFPKNSANKTGGNQRANRNYSDHYSVKASENAFRAHGGQRFSSTASYSAQINAVGGGSLESTRSQGGVEHSGEKTVLQPTASFGRADTDKSEELFNVNHANDMSIGSQAIAKERNEGEGVLKEEPHKQMKTWAQITEGKKTPRSKGEGAESGSGRSKAQSVSLEKISPVDTVESAAESKEKKRPLAQDDVKGRGETAWNDEAAVLRPDEKKRTPIKSFVDTVKTPVAVNVPERDSEGLYVKAHEDDMSFVNKSVEIEAGSAEDGSGSTEKRAIARDDDWKPVMTDSRPGQVNEVLEKAMQPRQQYKKVGKVGRPHGKNAGQKQSAWGVLQKSSAGANYPSSGIGKATEKVPSVQQSEIYKDNERSDLAQPETAIKARGHLGDSQIGQDSLEGASRTQGEPTQPASTQYLTHQAKPTMAQFTSGDKGELLMGRSSSTTPSQEATRSTLSSTGKWVGAVTKSVEQQQLSFERDKVTQQLSNTHKVQSSISPRAQQLPVLFRKNVIPPYSEHLVESVFTISPNTNQQKMAHHRPQIVGVPTNTVYMQPEESSATSVPPSTEMSSTRRKIENVPVRKDNTMSAPVAPQAPSGNYVEAYDAQAAPTAAILSAHGQLAMSSLSSSSQPQVVLQNGEHVIFGSFNNASMPCQQNMNCVALSMHQHSNAAPGSHYMKNVSHGTAGMHDMFRGLVPPAQGRFQSPYMIQSMDGPPSTLYSHNIGEYMAPQYDGGEAPSAQPVLAHASYGMNERDMSMHHFYQGQSQMMHVPGSRIDPHLVMKPYLSTSSVSAEGYDPMMQGFQMGAPLGNVNSGSTINHAAPSSKVAITHTQSGSAAVISQSFSPHSTEPAGQKFLPTASQGDGYSQTATTFMTQECLAQPDMGASLRDNVEPEELARPCDQETGGRQFSSTMQRTYGSLVNNAWTSDFISSLPAKGEKAQQDGKEPHDAFPALASGKLNSSKVSTTPTLFKTVSAEKANRIIASTNIDRSLDLSGLVKQVDTTSLFQGHLTPSHSGSSLARMDAAAAKTSMTGVAAQKTDSTGTTCFPEMFTDSTSTMLLGKPPYPLRMMIALRQVLLTENSSELESNVAAATSTAALSPSPIVPPMSAFSSQGIAEQAAHDERVARIKSYGRSKSYPLRFLAGLVYCYKTIDLVKDANSADQLTSTGVTSPQKIQTDLADTLGDGNLQHVLESHQALLSDSTGSKAAPISSKSSISISKAADTPGKQINKLLEMQPSGFDFLKSLKLGGNKDSEPNTQYISQTISTHMNSTTDLSGRILLTSSMAQRATPLISQQLRVASHLGTQTRSGVSGHPSASEGDDWRYSSRVSQLSLQSNYVQKANNTSLIAELKRKQNASRPNRDLDEREVLQRKLRLILNKLTVDKFDELYAQILNSGLHDVEDVRCLAMLLFAKAQVQHQYIPMYVNVCSRLKNDLIQMGIFDSAPVEEQDEDADGAPVESATDAARRPKRRHNAFRHLLVDAAETMCTNIVEQGTKSVDMSTEDGFEQYLLLKKKLRGNMIFISELCKSRMLAVRVIMILMVSLLKEPSDWRIEAFCDLCAASSSVLQLHPAHIKEMTNLFKIADSLLTDDNDKMSARVKCLVVGALESWHEELGAGIRELGTDSIPAKYPVQVEMMPTVRTTKIDSYKMMLGDDWNYFKTKYASQKIQSKRTKGSNSGRRTGSTGKHSQQKAQKQQSAQHHGYLKQTGLESEQQSGYYQQSYSKQGSRGTQGKNAGNVQQRSQAKTQYGGVYPNSPVEKSSQRGGSTNTPAANSGRVQHPVSNSGMQRFSMARDSCSMETQKSGANQDTIPVEFDLSYWNSFLTGILSTLAVVEQVQDKLETIKPILVQCAEIYSHENLIAMVQSCLTRILPCRINQHPAQFEWLLRWQSISTRNDVLMKAMVPGIEKFLKQNYKSCKMELPNLKQHLQKELLERGKQMHVLDEASLSELQKLLNTLDRPS